MLKQLEFPNMFLDYQLEPWNFNQLETYEMDLRGPFY